MTDDREFLILKNEIWKDIAGYSNFMISNLGRVKSKQRKVRYVHAVTKEEHFRVKREEILKCHLSKFGYYFVNLRGDDGIKKNKTIHRLVASGFLPNPNKYTVVNHIDGCKTNNHINNLEWCSNEYNHKHAAINSLVTHGESHPNSKIDRNTVELLKIKMALGYSDIELSKEYNINRSLINSIRNNHIWAHVNIPEGIQPIKSNRSAQVGILVYKQMRKEIF